MFKHRHANNTPGPRLAFVESKTKQNKKKYKKKKQKKTTTNKQTCDFARMVLFLHCEEENAFY